METHRTLRDALEKHCLTLSSQENAVLKETQIEHPGETTSIPLSKARKDKYCSKVFVYGTLKENHSNNNILSRTSENLGECVTEGKFALGSVGFPYAYPEDVVPREYKRLLYPIRGELWQIYDDKTADSLDTLEGFPVHYDRRLVQVSSGDTAWMYVQTSWYTAARCDACTLRKGAWQWP
jgi:gamma-glutamylcyclotransferase (GGCT)/AIG2-like uncharacterized protein YtfP